MIRPARVRDRSPELVLLVLFQECSTPTLAGVIEILSKEPDNQYAAAALAMARDEMRVRTLRVVA
jgi:hypothetical protein